MLRPRRNGDRQQGQILILFALVLVVILGFSSIVIDVGMLRNNRQTLANTMDSAALAGGTLMPVDGSVAGDATKVTNLINSTIAANYPGLPTTQYSITYKCLIGITTGSPPVANIARDIPTVCDPHFSLGHTPVAADFHGAGDTRYAACNPSVGDKCNTVVTAGSATTDYSFGRVVGVNQGSTGVITSAACNGPCGQPPLRPLDVVLIIDRTGSMAGDEANLQNAANAVLLAYDPNIQHVALGTLGPSNGPSSPCAGGSALAMPLDLTTTAPLYTTDTMAANASGGATTLVITKPASTASGDFLLAGITVDGGTAAVITPPAGWTLVQRTDSTTNVSVASYRKFAGGAEAASYTWTIGTSRRASGGILRFTGVDPITPIDALPTGTIGNSTSVLAPTATTTVANTAIVGFFGIDTSATFTNAALAEQFDALNTNSGGPATEGATGTKGAAGATGTKLATATAGARWAAQTIALRPIAQVAYGTNSSSAADIAKWVPVGLTGVANAPILENYQTNSTTLNPSSKIVNGIACASFNLSGTGTNLATPIDMARAYLVANGRPGVKQGIIFETDGQPNYNGSSGDSNNYTCAAALAAATTAKAPAGANLDVFTIGFGIDTGAAANCPDGGTTVSTLANMASGPILGTSLCNAAENTDNDHFFCEPAGADLTAVFHQAALQLAGLRSHLVQLLPAPELASISPASGTRLGGTTVTITGMYFTEATSVKFGGATGTVLTVVSDTTITVRAPAGAVGTTVDITVTTPGGTSRIISADRFTYT